MSISGKILSIECGSSRFQMNVNDIPSLASSNKSVRYKENETENKITMRSELVTSAISSRYIDSAIAFKTNVDNLTHINSDRWKEIGIGLFMTILLTGLIVGAIFGWKAVIMAVAGSSSAFTPLFTVLTVKGISLTLALYAYASVQLGREFFDGCGGHPCTRALSLVISSVLFGFLVPLLVSVTGVIRNFGHEENRLKGGIEVCFDTLRDISSNTELKQQLATSFEELKSRARDPRAVKGSFGDDGVENVEVLQQEFFAFLDFIESLQPEPLAQQPVPQLQEAPV